MIAGQPFRLGGDIIVAADGKKVKTNDQFSELIGSHKPGDRVQLQIVRGGKQRTVTVALGRRPTLTPG
jgi:putative serine protease PepD